MLFPRFLRVARIGGEGIAAPGVVGHVTPGMVEEKAKELRLRECPPAKAPVSFDCSLSLLYEGGRRLTLLFDWRSRCARRLQRRSVRNIAAEPFGKSGFIVGIDLRIVAAARHGDVCKATIDELFFTLSNFDAGCILDAQIKEFIDILRGL
jgi:hypothetical protein